MSTVYSGYPCPIQDGKLSIWWAEYIFNRCFYSYWEVSSAVFGVASVVFWLIALLPQIHTNWRRKSTTGISTYLILFWAIGDTMSLVGCIVLDQKPFQIILSSYFILIDTLLLTQYFIYRKPKAAKVPVISCMEETYLLQRSPSASDMQATLFYSSTMPIEPNMQLHPSNKTSKPNHRTMNAFSGSSSLCCVSRPGILIVSVLLFLVWFVVHEYSTLGNSFGLETFGLLMGWGSSINYHLSRLPQLWLNHKRKSVDGLSLAMFAIIFAANASYAASLLSMIPVSGPKFFYKSASYIYGPVGSIVIDVFVLIQFFSLRKAHTPSSGRILP